MKYFITLCIVSILVSCASKKNTTTNSESQVLESKDKAQILVDYNTFLITSISDDETYGYSSKNPIEVGGASMGEGPINERRFLNALAGPNGEEVSYFRAGSCCPIKSNNDAFGTGTVILDNYRVTWENSKDTVSIYINMYDSSLLKAPKGFTLKKK